MRGIGSGCFAVHPAGKIHAGEEDDIYLEPTSTSPFIVLNTLPDSALDNTVEIAAVLEHSIQWWESHPPSPPPYPHPPPLPPPPLDPPTLPLNAVAPRMLHEPDINYPIDLKEQKIEGRELLFVVLDDKGAVIDVRVQETSGYTAFDSAAVTGIRNATFSPAYLDDRSLAVKVRLPVFFELQL